MKTIRKVCALPFNLVGLLFVLLAVAMCSAAERIEGGK
jgi:hypothetical protein